MREATVNVGLVSPRSTCESIGALTPLRAARSRSERSAASRSAFTRAPITFGSSGSAGEAGAGGRSRSATGARGLPRFRRCVGGYHTRVRYHGQQSRAAVEARVLERGSLRREGRVNAV